jgi:hypothetical protein
MMFKRDMFDRTFTDYRLDILLVPADVPFTMFGAAAGYITVGLFGYP